VAPVAKNAKRIRGGGPGRTEVIGVETELLAREHVERMLRIENQRTRERAGGREFHAACCIDERQFLCLLFRVLASSSRSSPIWYSYISRCERTETYSPAAIESAPASRPATPLVSTKARIGTGAGNAEDQAGVRQQPVV